MSMTAGFRRQLQAVDDADGVLLLVEIVNAALAGPVHVVNDVQDWVISGVPYIGVPMAVTLPQDVAKEAAKAQLEVANDGGALIAELEALPPGVSLQVTLRLVSRANPDLVEWEFTTDMQRASASGPVITFSLGDDDFFRQPCVALRHDPDTSPGLFAG